MKIIRKCTYKNILPNIGERAFVKKSRYIISKNYENGMLIINTYSDSIVFLDCIEASNFNIMTDDETLIQTPLQEALYEQGILVDSMLNEYNLLEKNMLESSINSKNADVFTIFPTQCCNAKCKYCFELGEKKLNMSDKVVEDTIKYLLKTINCEHRTIFRWFGGEPLLAKNTIDKIINAIYTFFGENLRFQSMITTNGLLLDEDIINNAVLKWHLSSIHLTVDGYGIDHSIRKGYDYKNNNAYEMLIHNIEYLIKSNVMVVCRINIDKNNYDQLGKIITDLKKFSDSRFFKVDIAPIRGDYNASYDVTEFKELYINTYRQFVVSGLLKSFIDVMPKRLFENCVAGVNNSVVINAEGNFYKCILHSTDKNERYGNVALGITNQHNCEKWMDVKIHHMCRKCAFLPVCFGGCKEFWNVKKSCGIPCHRIKYFYEDLMDEICNYEIC